jgi:hypothetical protein
MMEKEFPNPLENDIIGIACVEILLGAAAIQFVGWSILGWVIVGLGLLTLWLAYLLATAPCYVEPMGTADHSS